MSNPQIGTQIAHAITRAKPYLDAYLAGDVLSDTERKAIVAAAGVAEAANKIAAALGGAPSIAVAAIVGAVINVRGIEAVTAWFESFRSVLARGTTIAIQIEPLGAGVQIVGHGAAAPK